MRPDLLDVHLDADTCLPTATGITFSSERRSLAFIVSVRGTSQAALNGLAQNSNDFVRDIQSGSPYWIIRYTFIIMNETSQSGSRTWDPS